MAQRRFSFVVLSCILLNACDPQRFFEVRNSVQPAPPFQCIVSSIQGMPDVITTAKPAHRKGYDRVLVQLRDSATGTRQDATIIRDSTGIKVFYAFPVGLLVGGPSAAELQRASQQGRRVLTVLISACAPTAPERFECVIDNQRVVSCASPAA